MMQQGEQLLSQILGGQVDGQTLGRAVFDLLPCLPFETGGFFLPVPRILARRMAFPGAAPPAPRPAIPLAPPSLEPAAALPAPAAPPTPAAPPPPPPGPRSVRIEIHERRGMM